MLALVACGVRWDNGGITSVTCSTLGVFVLLGGFAGSYKMVRPIRFPAAIMVICGLDYLGSVRLGLDFDEVWILK